jgi:hypothetical protein
MDGDDLFSIVQSYSDLGDHRTGTAIDEATLSWFEDHVARLGFSARRHAFEFPRFSWESSLTADDAPVAHIPVYYCFSGHCDTTDVHCEVVDGFLQGGRHEVLEPVLTAARRDAEGAVAIAIDHPLGLLVGVNHPPAEPAGVPAVLVGGRDLDRLRNARTRVRLDAEVEQGSSGNVIARRGRGVAAPLMISTPLSGWFRCAGERGTGIAVLLGVLARLPAELPVLVVGTSGHELDFIGARHALRDVGRTPLAVVHIGASVGVVGADGMPAARATATGEFGGASGGVTSALSGIGMDLSFDERRWVGEAAFWRSFEVPLLSLSGAGEQIHTPDDLPDAVTSPATLAAVTVAVTAAVVEVLRTSAGLTNDRDAEGSDGARL